MLNVSLEKVAEETFSRVYILQYQQFLRASTGEQRFSFFTPFADNNIIESLVSVTRYSERINELCVFNGIIH